MFCLFQHLNVNLLYPNFLLIYDVKQKPDLKSHMPKQSQQIRLITKVHANSHVCIIYPIIWPSILGYHMPVHQNCLQLMKVRCLQVILPINASLVQKMSLKLLPSFFSFILSATYFSVSTFGQSSSPAIKITHDTWTNDIKLFLVSPCYKHVRFETTISEISGRWERKCDCKDIDKWLVLPIASSDRTFSAQSVHCWPENSDGLSSKVAILLSCCFLPVRK